MIRYLEPLYTTEKTENKLRSVKRAFRMGSGVIGIYLITIASGEKDVFDIFPAALLKQRAFRHRDYDVIGIAESKEAAFEVVSRIYAQYHAAFSTYEGIRSELKSRLQEQEKKP